MELYYLISFPEIQDFMEKEDWDKCIFCMPIEGHDCPDLTWAVPKYIYDRVHNK